MLVWYGEELVSDGGFDFSKIEVLGLGFLILVFFNVPGFLNFVHHDSCISSPISQPSNKVCIDGG